MKAVETRQVSPTGRTGRTNQDVVTKRMTYAEFFERPLAIHPIRIRRGWGRSRGRISSTFPRVSGRPLRSWSRGFGSA